MLPFRFLFSFCFSYFYPLGEKWWIFSLLRQHFSYDIIHYSGKLGAVIIATWENIMIIKLLDLNNYSISEHFTLHINHYWRLIVEGYRELTKLKIQLKFKWERFTWQYCSAVSWRWAVCWRGRGGGGRPRCCCGDWGSSQWYDSLSLPPPGDCGREL